MLVVLRNSLVCFLTVKKGTLKKLPDLDHRTSALFLSLAGVWLSQTLQTFKGIYDHRNWIYFLYINCSPAATGAIVFLDIFSFIWLKVVSKFRTRLRIKLGQYFFFSAHRLQTLPDQSLSRKRWVVTGARSSVWVHSNMNNTCLSFRSPVVLREVRYIYYNLKRNKQTWLCVCGWSVHAGFFSP